MTPFRRIATWSFAACLVAAASVVIASRGAHSEEESEPAKLVVGERLFLETRFAQHFFANSHGDVNARDVPPDPALADTATTDEPLRGPFRPASMNCRACHLVDEHRKTPGGGVRTYADFARRSPIPDRGDGLTVTLRNSPSLVGSSQRRRDALQLLHFDGEFASAEDLVVGTFTGRNFGWLPGERDTAIRHIARVLRRDDGNGPLARQAGGNYARLLTGTSPSIPSEFRLPPGFRVDVERASDEALVRAAAHLVAAYLRSLSFARDEDGVLAGSAFDVFLSKNDLPQRRRLAETPERFTARLRTALSRLREPEFVSGRDGHLRLHDADFVFGPRELRGLNTFLRRPADGGEQTSGVGNCAACHAPPDFSDFRFHVTGVSQLEFDRVHGDGAFLVLEIPGLAARNADPNSFLPPTPERPAALGPFASIPSAAFPGHADLGVWNVLFDPDRVRPQTQLDRNMALGGSPAADDAELLLHAIAAFKTPSVRDLGQSSPYMHDGSLDTLADAVRQYVTVSDLARAGRLRNADPEIVGIRLDDGDVRDLAAFLSSLREDYE